MPVEPETHVFRTVHGCALRADVYRPASPGPHPALLWLHGGALIFGSRRTLRPWQAQRYRDEGYLVVAPDYRLAPETRLPDIVADVEAAWRWLHEEGAARFGVDERWTAVVGHSAGGYLALLLATRMPIGAPVPRAVVSFYGYGDILGDWYTRPDRHYLTHPPVSAEQAQAVVGSEPVVEGPPERFHFYLRTRQQGTWPQEVGGRDPVVEADFFRRYCPLNRVSPKSSPTLLLHGDADTDVPYEQSVLMQAALAGAGVEARLHTVAGGPHAFDKDGEDAVTVAAFDEVTSFLSRHLGRAR